MILKQGLSVMTTRMQKSNRISHQLILRKLWPKSRGYYRRKSRTESPRMARKEHWEKSPLLSTVKQKVDLLEELKD